MTFANNLDPDQGRRSVGPDLGLNYLQRIQTVWHSESIPVCFIYVCFFLKYYVVDFEEKRQQTKTNTWTIT